jgi:hypothetical protein
MSIYDNADGYIYPYNQKNYDSHDKSINQFKDVKRNPLLQEDTDTNKNIINKKYKNLENERLNVNSSNEKILTKLVFILNRLEKIEKQINSTSKNSYDIIIYILIGALISFLIYSIVNAISK